MEILHSINWSREPDNAFLTLITIFNHLLKQPLSFDTEGARTVFIRLGPGLKLARDVVFIRNARTYSQLVLRAALSDRGGGDHRKQTHHEQVGIFSILITDYTASAGEVALAVRMRLGRISELYNSWLHLFPPARLLL